MNEKVLIIDDLPFNIRLLKEILEDEGYSVSCICENIDETAIATICEIKPALVFVDVMMPQISGYELCREIKANPLIQSIPVIMLSAMSDSDSIDKAFEAGAFSFISKPYSEGRILAIAKSAIDTAHHHVPDVGPSYLQKRESRSDDRLQGQCDIDAETIFHKLSRDMEFFRETTRSFEESSYKLMADIRESILKADEKQLRQGTHALKSLVLYFNANKALTDLTQLDGCAVHKDSELINNIYNSLKNELECIANSLKNFIESRE